MPWFGPGQVDEGHLHSDQGWSFSGYTRFGFPFPYVGHNESLGWVSADNSADLADLYAERFEDPLNPLAYRYGTGTREAREWSDSIGVRVQDRDRGSRSRFGGRTMARSSASATGERSRCEWPGSSRTDGCASGTT